MLPQEIPSDLHDAVKGKSWSDAARILEKPSNHIQVEYVGTGALGNHGTNTVHWAAFHHDTPHDLMKKITSVSRKACMTAQKFGALPLHSACRFSCDENTVILAEMWPEAASVPNKGGDLALHYVVIHGRSTKVMKAVLKANPKAALHNNMYNDSPLSIFLEEWDSGLEDILKSEKLHFSQVLNTNISDCGGRKCSLKVLFERTLLLLKGAVNQEIEEEEDDKTYPLHLALQIPFLPFSFFKAFLLVHPDHVWMKDKNGSLPLHLACATPNQNSLKMIKELLKINPKAARTLDGSQRLPLHIALEHGNYSVIEDIIQSAPEAVNTRDYVCRLVPFMAAAIESKKEGDEKDLEQLNAIYSLLTREPSFISWALGASDSRKRKRQDEDADRHGAKPKIILSTYE